MKIVIAHLYYDLLNLYGESGNVKALKKYLENQGIEVVLENKSVNEKFEFGKYDFIYIGSGTENNLSIALEDLKRYRKEIKEYIKNNKFFLSTGSSIEIFGKSISFNDKVSDGLNIFPYTIKRENKRYVCESVLNYKKYDLEVIGFQNRCGFMYQNDKAIFEVIKGNGMNLESKEEGLAYNNFIGTYTVGPILARNPELLSIIANDLILSIDKDYKIKEIYRYSRLQFNLYSGTL